ncbi:TPA: hypothetical protein ACRZR4_001511, partial [Acinetobacter baumannii]
MAILTPETFENIHKDAETFEEVISGDEFSDVISRLGRKYPTLAKMMKILQQSGQRSYANYALFEADKSNIPSNTTVRIAEGENAGLFVWDGANLTKVETSNNPYTISSTPDDLFIISDALDNVLFSIGRDGTVRGSFDLSSIDLNIESTSEVGGDTVLAVSDNTGNMLASLNSKGEWYFTKIIADEVVTPFGSSSES